MPPPWTLNSMPMGTMADVVHYVHLGSGHHVGDHARHNAAYAPVQAETLLGFRHRLTRVNAILHLCHI